VSGSLLVALSSFLRPMTTPFTISIPPPAKSNCLLLDQIRVSARVFLSPASVRLVWSAKRKDAATLTETLFPV
jgi:hypothetical protein